MGVRDWGAGPEGHGAWSLSLTHAPETGTRASEVRCVLLWLWNVACGLGVPMDSAGSYV